VTVGTLRNAKDLVLAGAAVEYNTLVRHFRGEGNQDYWYPELTGSVAQAYSSGEASHAKLIASSVPGVRGDGLSAAGFGRYQTGSVNLVFGQFDAAGNLIGNAPSRMNSYSQYKVLRSDGLSASDAYTVLSRNFSVSKLGDGTIVTSLGRSAHLEASLLGDGDLNIDSMFVSSSSLRGQGISNELFQKTISSVGAHNVSAVKGYFGPGTNLEVFRSGVASGMTPEAAAASTPLGRTVIKGGFGNIKYD